MYERKKRDSVRAGSASYVSRRHFSTICQSPPRFSSLLSSFYRALICIVSRRGHRRSQTAFVEHSLSPWKNGRARRERRAAYSYPPGANPGNSRCERQSADEWNVEANAIFPHTYTLLKTREFRPARRRGVRRTYPRILAVRADEQDFSHSINVARIIEQI